jgi:hypothetical protein
MKPASRKWSACTSNGGVSGADLRRWKGDEHLRKQMPDFVILDLMLPKWTVSLSPLAA